MSSKGVYNFYVEPDSEDEEDDNIFDEVDEEGCYDSADEETEDKAEFLQKILNDVANVYVLGYKAYKIDFHDMTKKVFEHKDINCDFDYDKKGFPIMIDGGEEYIAPYLKKVSEKDLFFEECTFETNHGFRIEL